MYLGVIFVGPPSCTIQLIEYWDKDSLFDSFICEFRFIYLYNYFILSDFLNCPKFYLFFVSS